MQNKILNCIKLKSLQIFKIYANFIRYIMKKKALNIFDAVFCKNT